MNVMTRAAAVAAVLLAPLAVSAQATPTAEAIIARHVAAIGGADAILKVTSMKTIGTLQVPAAGISATIETVAAAPNRMGVKMTIPGIGEIANGYDGTVAWEVNPLQGPRIKTGKEIVTAQEEADFHGGMLFAKERYASTENVGQTDFAGEKVWHIKAVLKSGRVAQEYFSVATGLHVGSQTTQESPQGTLDVTTVDSAYKQFGGIKLATRSEMTTGAQKMLVTLTDVVLGEVPPSAFALPAPIKALVKP